MPAFRPGVRRWIVVAAIVLIGAIVGRPPAANATSATFEVGDGAVVQVIGRAAAITIRTWNRNVVQVDWPDGQPFEPSRSTLLTRPSFLIPTVTVDEYDTPSGPVSATLLPEDFPVPNLVPGMHDVVRVKENLPPPLPGRAVPNTELTVTIPVSVGLVNVRTGRGSIALWNYHGTTIAALGGGRIVMHNVSGDAFVQPLNGRFYARDSDFDRLRIRSNRADEIFDACSVKQIEATTLTGNIIFDNGTFNAGLARFESDRGSIALGVNGGAQLSAHTQDGRVATMLPAAAPPPSVFGNPANVNDPAGGDAVFVVGGGGPLVNALSDRGNVFLYDGSLSNRRPAALPPDWRPMQALFNAARAGMRAPARRR